MTHLQQISELYNLIHQYNFAKGNIRSVDSTWSHEANDAAKRFNTLIKALDELPLLPVPPVVMESAVTITEEFHKN